MRVVVVGATGRTGRHLLGYALAAGHHVTAVARDPSRIGGSHPRLEVLSGDLFDAFSVERAIRGRDAVLCAAGTGTLGTARCPTTLYSVGTRHILNAMVRHGVSRLITITSAGTTDDPSLPWFFRHVVRRLLAPTLHDMGRMEREIVSNPLAWTVVRPARLVDLPTTGRYRLELETLPPGGREIGRADLASFMVQHLERPDFVRRFVAVAY